MPNDPAVAVTDTTDQEKPLTRADLMALLSGELGKVVNAAVTSHTKRLQKSFDERFAALTPAPAKADGDGDGDEPTIVDLKAATKPAAGALPIPAAPDPRIAEMEKRMAALVKANEASVKQAKEERRARIESDGYASVRSALAERVTKGAEGLGLSALRDRGAILIGDDGSVRIRLGSKDEPEDGLDLPEGLDAFLKSPEAKFIAPAPTAGPQNAKRPGYTPSRQSGQQAESAEERFRQLTGKSLSDALSG